MAAWDVERFLLEERAAIMEYDGGLPRAEAERLARICLEEPPPLPPKQQPEQLELGMDQAEFRQAMRKLWNDY